MHNRFLTNLALHISLDPSETDLVLAKLHSRQVKKNTYLLREGDICRHFYFVNEGCIRLFHTDSKGEDHNILFCPENWWITDITSFSGQLPAFYSISTMEDSEIFYFTHDELEQLYLTVPKIERFFRILIQNGFSMYQRRITSNLSLAADERYARFSQLYPGIEQRITQKQIASYLGITPAFLSMIRGKKL
ncbi:Crp/Fnr family transcriptional regulator [[Flexibacter] sp. ATCC 35208]|uniref:Crp/Fnr family transcriptional regulator n=1 Tax=[Flexibacter] sp. ATCC 35208 TaxID=1936242 RepID=UPI0009CF5992|nr:Crp/Fnr family transcriptional regulator [[Flexibacter] sp. ATCC 35208]OMP76361.1 Crp/Fnr family transcriptional regulator [[Flexibacter] sp. ATCC 35208]